MNLTVQHPQCAQSGIADTPARLIIKTELEKHILPDLTSLTMQYVTIPNDVFDGLSYIRQERDYRGWDVRMVDKIMYPFTSASEKETLIKVLRDPQLSNDRYLKAIKFFCENVNPEIEHVLFPDRLASKSTREAIKDLIKTHVTQGEQGTIEAMKNAPKFIPIAKRFELDPEEELVMNGEYRRKKNEWFSRVCYNLADDGTVVKRIVLPIPFSDRIVMPGIVFESVRRYTDNELADNKRKIVVATTLLVSALAIAFFFS